jgi:hypothetical protein
MSSLVNRIFAMLATDKSILPTAIIHIHTHTHTVRSFFCFSLKLASSCLVAGDA